MCFCFLVFSLTAMRTLDEGVVSCSVNVGLKYATDARSTFHLLSRTVVLFCHYVYTSEAYEHAMLF